MPRRKQKTGTKYAIVSKPDGPPQSGVAHGLYLISVSGVGEALVASATKYVLRKLEETVEGTFNKDMTNDKMTSAAHRQIVKPLSQTCDHIWRSSVRSEKKVRVCAHGWQLPLSGRETARKMKKKIREVRKTTNGVLLQVNLTTIETFSH